MRKMRRLFFSRNILFDRIIFFCIISNLYPCFTHPLYTVIKGNIVYAQNYKGKCKKCFSILKKSFACGGLRCLSHSAYLLQSEFQLIIQTVPGFIQNSQDLLPANVVLFLYLYILNLVFLHF